MKRVSMTTVTVGNAMVRGITAADLKKFLSELPPETLIVVPGSDHSYRRAGVQLTRSSVYLGEGGCSRSPHLAECYEELDPTEGLEGRHPVVVID